jgi:hypothetical protein
MPQDARVEPVERILLGAHGGIASLAATIDAAAASRTFSAASNYSDELQLAMANLLLPSWHSLGSPPSWIGSLTGLENTH